MGFKLGNTTIGSLYVGSTKIGSAYLGSTKVYESIPPVPTYYHVYTSATNGTITATPVSGISGTTVTLSNTPDTGYEFDSYSITGATLYDTNKFDINNSDVTVVGNFIINYNPLNLPPNTIRVRTSDGNVPIKASSTSYTTATLVSGTSNVYDIYKSYSFDYLLYGSTNVTEVLGANTTGITNMASMFNGCTSLTSVPLFDTSDVTSMNYMFAYCSSLKSIPLYNTYKVSNMASMFYNCYKVESGSLALYQQASSQTIPPSSHGYCFRNCGKNTTTGKAELAQIPSGWK